jgi:large subunit ribosomal protein L3
MTIERNVKGLLGTKLGMTQTWDENNRIVPVTVVAAGTNVVTQVRLPETDGYNAVQLGFGEIDGRKVTKPRAGHFEKAGVTPRRHLTEVRTADAAEYSAGQELAVDTVFEAGQLVDVVGTSKGKGYAGVMKRHGFHGSRASHGAHRNHRKPGSIGASSTPSRVFKGMRMAGRMGGERVTVLNLKFHSVDAEKGLLLVKGAVPGARGRIVFVRNAVKGA